jgi:ribonuclease HI
MKKITIYTDGACSGNPGPGGWGAVLFYRDVKKEIFGGKKETTNNQMELQAVIEALSLLKESSDLTIYTDSKYVLDGITKWIKSWKEKGWKTANKQPVKNKELWISLDQEANKHKINWKWVKGHSGDKGNDIADELAVKGRDFYIN